MSKTKQRKDQAYYEGFHDARKEKPFRWKSHPYIGRYRRGYRDGQAALKEKREWLPTLGYDDL